MQQIAFLLVAGAAFGYAGKRFWDLRKKILLGKDEVITGDAAQRWQNVALIAFGHKKMFKRWIPAVFTFFRNSFRSGFICYRIFSDS